MLVLPEFNRKLRLKNLILSKGTYSRAKVPVSQPVSIHFSYQSAHVVSFVDVLLPSDVVHLLTKTF